MTTHTTTPAAHAHTSRWPCQKRARSQALREERSCVSRPGELTSVGLYCRAGSFDRTPKARTGGRAEEPAS